MLKQPNPVFIQNSIIIITKAWVVHLCDSASIYCFYNIWWNMWNCSTSIGQRHDCVILSSLPSKKKNKLKCPLISFNIFLQRKTKTSSSSVLLARLFLQLNMFCVRCLFATGVKVHIFCTFPCIWTFFDFSWCYHHQIIHKLSVIFMFDVYWMRPLCTCNVLAYWPVKKCLGWWVLCNM